MPTDLPIRAKKKIIASETGLVALISIVPWLACLLLAHAFPEIAGAFALVGQIS